MIETNQDFPGYATFMTPEARAIQAGLPPELRLKVMDVLDQLSLDPKNFDNRTRKATDGKNIYVYEHPDPSLQITYQLIEDSAPKLIRFIHIAVLKIEIKRTLFISYSHEDLPWLERVRKFLILLEDQDMAIWDDRQIQTGAIWREEIQNALNNARAALLLVSQDFIASQFIKNEELPALLKKAESEGLKIFWVPLRPSGVQYTTIYKYQAAVSNPDLPIDQSAPNQQDSRLVEVYEKVAGALGLLRPAA